MDEIDVVAVRTEAEERTKIEIANQLEQEANEQEAVATRLRQIASGLRR
jgi:Ribonuclease G/E